MAKDRATLDAEIASELADNTSGAISAQDVRDNVSDVFDAAFTQAGETQIASATTTNIGATADDWVEITGSATITSFGTVQNVVRVCRFSGTATVQHNATSLDTPSGQDIIASPGDVIVAKSDGSGNWRIILYKPAGRPALIASPNKYTKAQKGTEAPLTDAANISWNLSDGNFFNVVLAGNRTLDLPSGFDGVQTGYIRVVQDATGGRTLDLSAFKAAGGTLPTLSISPNAVDYLYYTARSASDISLSFLGDVK